MANNSMLFFKRREGRLFKRGSQKVKGLYTKFYHLKDGHCLVSLKAFFIEENNAMVYIVMGVSGSGKTTVGELLAQNLGLPFYDADDFHPDENISKMKEGIPLSDEDRDGWLKTLAGQILKWEEAGGAVLACSALKEKYRKTLCSQLPEKIEWIFLKGSKELIKERILHRKAHFMNAGLLDSQFEILEEPKYGITVPIDRSAKVVVETILQTINEI
jgi:carbohydrate kinase (thermoresistant glucokinase family)